MFKMKAAQDEEMKRILASIFNIGEGMWGRFIVDIIDFAPMKKWEFAFKVHDLEWSMYVAYEAHPTHEELRTMMERDYLRELDAKRQ